MAIVSLLFSFRQSTHRELAKEKGTNGGSRTFELHNDSGSWLVIERGGKCRVRDLTTLNKRLFYPTACEALRKRKKVKKKERNLSCDRRSLMIFIFFFPVWMFVGKNPSHLQM
eukprot:TRINITY_DN11237_c0_g1_i1.p1 TRINITY_DN11237_c0_g1~~TRINITY_DN11237_c0_g1_i1.p1  ORF type:complete len:113 (-),score=1.01 TRINITY_DN11237_c0_g1_i1:468-806(-)